MSPIVTEEGLHHCVNSRMAFVHKALVSASECHEGYRVVVDSNPGQSGMPHKNTGEWIGLREEKGGYVLEGWISLAMTAGRKKSVYLSLTRHERYVDAAPVIFSRQESHPQVEDQPMNPDDTVQVSEEVCVEGEEATPARGSLVSNAADTQRNSGTRDDASASPIVVWTLFEGKGNEASAFSHQHGGRACCQVITSSWVHLEKRKHKVYSRCWQ